MLDNGKELIAANHIRNVTDNLTLKEISGIALPQTNIREDPYQMFINYDQDRKITRKDCKCDWGGGTVHCFTYFLLPTISSIKFLPMQLL